MKVSRTMTCLSKRTRCLKNFTMNSYHHSTKHSYDSIRKNASFMDWSTQPSTYKVYHDSYKRVKLDERLLEHKFLYLIGGISAKKSYASGEYFLRTNPSAGALYPNELYFQVRGVEGFADGIYHFEVKSSSVVLLQTLDGDGVEKNLGLQKPIKGFIFLLSAVYFRSSWKYVNRAFRYCLLDGGHLLGQIEMSAYLKDFAVRHLYDFDKISLNTMFGFKDREFFMTASIVGVPRGEVLPKPLNISLPFVDATGSFFENERVKEAYHDSLVVRDKRVCTKASKFTFRKDVFEETMIKRRSIREMSKQGISKDAFTFIMDAIHQSVMSDCDEVVEIYVIVNRVINMPVGVYTPRAGLRDHDGQFEKYGDFSKKAGYLCLEQYHLGENSAFTVFLTSKSVNYQAMYQKAGIIGNRLYLASNYLQIGCSGIGAYYDDEVASFLELNEENMVLYGICIGN